MISQPDRPAGRGKRLQHSPVKTVALDEGLPVWQPETLKTAESEAILTRFDCDILIVVAYGLILPPAILQIPRLGCLNVHASLLPRWRGAAPVQRAIEAGDAETGVSVMAMEPGLDTGPVLLTRTLPIQPHHTSGALLNDLAEIGAARPWLPASTRSTRCSPQRLPQNHHDAATYAHKIDKTEAALDWSGHAADLARRIRAFCPAPGCYTHLQSDRFKVLSAYAAAQSSQRPRRRNFIGRRDRTAGGVWRRHPGDYGGAVARRQSPAYCHTAQWSPRALAAGPTCSPPQPAPDHVLPPALSPLALSTE